MAIKTINKEIIKKGLKSASEIKWVQKGQEVYSYCPDDTVGISTICFDENEARHIVKIRNDESSH